MKVDIITLLIHGRVDPTVAVSNSLSYAAALKEHGSTVTLKLYRFMEHMGPIIWLLPGLRWLSPISREIKRFISRNS